MSYAPRLFVLALLTFGVSSEPTLRPGAAAPQQSEPTSKLDVFQYFVGDWKGTGTGASGPSTLERTYAFVLDEQFVRSATHAVFTPSEEGAEAATHADIGMMSYDRARSTYVLREFHSEGYINRYVPQFISEDSTVFAFVSESIENIESGWKARYTVTILGEDEFEDTFELCPPNGEYFTSGTNKLHRVKAEEPAK